MLGGRSLVNNSIFNLVLMLPPLLLSPTSSSLFPFPSPRHSRSLYFASSCFLVVVPLAPLPTVSSFYPFSILSFAGTYSAVSTSR